MSSSLISFKCLILFCLISRRKLQSFVFANLPSAIFQSARVLCNGSRMTFSSVRSFIISEISSFALLIGRTIIFHGEILSFVLLIGYIQNQYEFYSLRFLWVNLSTYEINRNTGIRSQMILELWNIWSLNLSFFFCGQLIQTSFYPGVLVTRTGEREIGSVSGRLPNNPAYMMIQLWLDTSLTLF